MFYSMLLPRQKNICSTTLGSASSGERFNPVPETVTLDGRG